MATANIFDQFDPTVNIFDQFDPPPVQDISTEGVGDFTGFERLETPTPPVFPSDPSKVGEFQRETVKTLREARRIEAVNRDLRMGEIRGLLGDEPFDDKQNLDRDFKELRLRADFQRSDKFKELQLKFLDIFPVGDLRTLQLETDENVLVFRENHNQAFKIVDPEGLFNIATLFDILPNIFNESVFMSGLFIAATGGSGSVARILLPAIGDAAGVLAQSVVERARGFEATTKGEVAEQAAIVGLFSAILGKILNFKKALQTKHPEFSDSAEIAEFAAREGALRPVVGQTAKSPLVRAAFQQAAGSIAEAQERITLQKTSLLASLRSRADAVKGGLEKTFTAIAEGRKKDLFKTMRGLITGKTKLDSAEAGEKIVLNFFDRERATIGKMYDSSGLVSQGAVFDLRIAQQAGTEARRGVVGGGREVTESIESSIVDEFGRPITRQVTSRPAIRADQPIEGQFSSALDDLAALDPNVRPFEFRGKTDNPFDVIKNLRTRFFLLSLPEAGTRRNQLQNAALQINKKLTEVLQSPRGGSSEFRSLLKIANKRNFDFERLTERGFIKSILRSVQAPSDVATKFAANVVRPGNPRQLRVLKKIATPAEFETFRQGYISSLMADPGTITRKLDAFGAANEASSLRLLLNSNENSALRTFSQGFRRLEKSNVQQELDRFADEAEKALSFLRKSSRLEIADTIKRAGGKTSQLAANFRAATYTDILSAPGVVQITNDGAKIVNTQAALKRFAVLLEERKVNIFMSVGELKNFNNFARLTAIFTGGMDVGGAMRRGAIAGAIREFGAFIRQVGAAHRILSDKFTVRMLSLPAGQRLLGGRSLAGLKPGSAKAIRAAGIMMGVIALDLERRSKKREATD